MSSTFSDFNKRYSEKYHKSLKKTCQPLFSLFGLNSFYYQTITEDGRFFSFITNPDLYYYYFVENQMYIKNPFIMQQSDLKSGFYFPDKIDDEELQRSEKAYHDKFGIKYCLVVTKKAKDICYEYGFGRPPQNHNIDALILNNLSIIKRFISYFREEMSDLIQKMHADPIYIKKDPLFYKKRSTQTKFPPMELKASEKIIFLNKIYPGKFFEGINLLTPRERTCIAPILTRKPARQIGEELKLSPRTVEFYIENIKAKLGCDTIQELFEVLDSYRSFEII